MRSAVAACAATQPLVAEVLRQVRRRFGPSQSAKGPGGHRPHRVARVAERAQHVVIGAVVEPERAPSLQPRGPRLGVGMARPRQQVVGGVRRAGEAQPTPPSMAELVELRRRGERRRRPAGVVEPYRPPGARRRARRPRLHRPRRLQPTTSRCGRSATPTRCGRWRPGRWAGARREAAPYLAGASTMNGSSPRTRPPAAALGAAGGRALAAATRHVGTGRQSGAPDAVGAPRRPNVRRPVMKTSRLAAAAVRPVRAALLPGAQHAVPGVLGRRLLPAAAAPPPLDAARARRRSCGRRRRRAISSSSPAYNEEATIADSLRVAAAAQLPAVRGDRRQRRLEGRHAGGGDRGVRPDARRRWRYQQPIETAAGARRLPLARPTPTSW